MEVEGDDFPPRDYQVELMEIALKENTIIYLPTGAGKTFIAILVLKSLQGSDRKYSEGGKISFFLVNTVALVDQHAKCLEKRTNLDVGKFCGEMGTDFWPKSKWLNEFDKHQVFVMTCQILVNIVNQNFLDLNKVNLLVFDECHRGVKDQPMRRVCMSMQHLQEKPRILGLTATLLNGNCKPSQVKQIVNDLEVSYQSKVGTVDGLSKVAGFSTNPKEIVQTFAPFKLSSSAANGLSEIENLITTLSSIKSTNDVFLNKVLLLKQGLKPMIKSEGLMKLTNIVRDVIIHIKMMGMYGGTKVIKAHVIQIERIKTHCDDPDLYETLNVVETTLIGVNRAFLKEMEGFTEEQKIFKFSSPKVLLLLEILSEYSRGKAQSELCAIIFTQRRFTAKVVFYILNSLSQSSSAYSCIKPNFIVGFNHNPFNDTRENLYTSKMNRKILQSFDNKEINVLCASDVLEEGVDITTCSLVVKFDRPLEYRSYIQSKGRARNPTSLFYIMVPEEEASNFDKKYKGYKTIERILERYLIGKNEWRQGPTDEQIQKMFNADEIKPYYADGLNSAKVDMISAIALLSHYCNSLSSDQYTVISPEYFLLKNSTNATNLKPCQVEIRLPVKSPLAEPIVGPPMGTQKLAKRAAALEACKKLHQMGELDDHLLPKKYDLVGENVDFLFNHHPAVNEPTAGTNKNKRLHKLQIPHCLKGRLIANKPVYLHLINLQVDFEEPTEINDSTLYHMYKSNLTYGLITPNEVPSVCDFPIYTSLGPIYVNPKINVSKVSLSQQDLNDVRKFNVVVLSDILNGLKSFIISDNGNDAENMIFVPVRKESGAIDFEVLRENKTVRPSSKELTSDERLKLAVTNESHLHKIVSPWYSNVGEYIVTEVTLEKTAKNKFPDDKYETYEHYYKDKYNITLLNPELPLLHVKRLTKRTNFFKPKLAQSKKEKDLDNMIIHLMPELVVKREFPASLWIQASFLPTIISRLAYLFRLEEFRAQMARQMQIGAECVPTKKPLELDPHLITYEPQVKKQPVKMLEPVDNNLSTIKIDMRAQHARKILENEYPWKESEEPKDIERDLDCTILDIEYYEMFLSQKISKLELTHRIKSPLNEEMKALTLLKDYTFKPIKCLETGDLSVGPQLNLIYKAMTTIKANDIVNMERLETMGDSFLKYIASIYIYVRFPKFNEGSATKLRGRLISNKNLYYLAVQKNIPGIMKAKDFELNSWLAPGFKVPDLIEERINNHETSLASLYKIDIPLQEQISGVLSEETVRTIIRGATTALDASEEGLLQDVAKYFKSNFIGDKNVADCVEALLGAYIESCGLIGGIRFVEWMNIIPPSENLLHLLQKPPINPIISPIKGDRKINFHLRDIKKIENILGYEFRHKGYLLQALTHATYTPNRITHSYERLEFLGDAVLDFLITCYIFESCGNLSPGEITDLRSALVNNNTFASLVVRNNLHKYLLMINVKLQLMVDRFVDYLQAKNYVIDDEVLILLEEKDVEGLNLAEYVDVPKVLGDVFEALAGAIYLDSGKDLKVVWKIFHRLMWREIQQFSARVPKNVLRRLHEYMPNVYPKFGSAEEVRNDTVMVPLQFMLERRRQQVFGFGSNKAMAKRAAAKLALRQLN